MTWQGSTTVRDRIFAALPYLLPLMDGLGFGEFLFRQFPVLRVIFLPLVPLLQIYRGVPFAGLIIFFALFLLVVRNTDINYFIRLNTMQAILIDIALILCSLVVPFLANAIAVPLVVETLYNTIFLAIVIACLYAVVSSVMGRDSEIPLISEAARMQVR
ncbi:MAG: Tic20 family protein [Hormoscilla sp.]